MAKYCGIVAYIETDEAAPGVWKEKIVKRKCYGDVLRNYRRLEGSDKVNNDINISNTISIVADPYAYRHCHAIQYIEWNGVRWKVDGVEINRPRINLTIGGVYNGQSY